MRSWATNLDEGPRELGLEILAPALVEPNLQLADVLPQEERQESPPANPEDDPFSWTLQDDTGVQRSGNGATSAPAHTRPSGTLRQQEQGEHLAAPRHSRGGEAASWPVPRGGSVRFTVAPLSDSGSLPRGDPFARTPPGSPSRQPCRLPASDPFARTPPGSPAAGAAVPGSRTTPGGSQVTAVALPLSTLQVAAAASATLSGIGGGHTPPPALPYWSTFVSPAAAHTHFDPRTEAMASK